MRKDLALFFCLVIFSQSVHARTAIILNNPPSAGGDSCPTCSTNLTQAFILDDGNADTEDWVGANDLTLGAGGAAPAWAGSNDGLVFDGTDDYATFTPTTTDWMAGYTIAILCTVPNANGDSIFHVDQSGDTNRRAIFGSITSTAYNRGLLRLGRQFSNQEGFTYHTSGTSAKAWYFGQYNDDGTANMYKDNASTPSHTDSSVTEFGTVAFDRGALGSDAATTGAFANTTIYRVLIYDAPMTETQRQGLLDGWTPTKS